MNQSLDTTTNRPLPNKSTGQAVHVTDAISLSGNETASLAITTTATQSAALTGGTYDVWATGDCYIKINAVANDVTTATGYLLRSGNTVPMRVPAQEKIGAIVAAGSVTLYYHKVS